MKTIGLIGGMSWKSSLEYYRIINETVKARLEGFHSAKSVMVSLDFAEVEALQSTGRWDEATALMIGAAQQVERAGADFVLICANTMHKMADEIQATITIPLLHIVDASAEAIKRRNLGTVGLLGTKFTMEQDFYSRRLEVKHGIQVLIPAAVEREVVHRVIFEELVLGIIKDDSRQRLKTIITHLIEAGAEGILLGCTEFGLLIKPEDSSVPVFDTSLIHAQAAVDWALEAVPG